MQGRQGLDVQTAMCDFPGNRVGETAHCCFGPGPPVAGLRAANNTSRAAVR